jgi:protein AIR1/2
VSAPPAPTRAPRDWETGDSFGDGWGASAPINVGKRARNKNRMRMEQRALEIQEQSDQDDWFGNPRNVRNRGMGGGSARREPRDNGTPGGSKDVKFRFGASRKRDDDSPRRGPSLLERVHAGDDKRSRQRRRDPDRDRDRDRGERHHRDRDRERGRDRDRDRDDDGSRPVLRIRGSASESKNTPHYHDDGGRREERRGEDRRRWEDGRSGDREQERHRDGHRERARGHERERRTSWDDQDTRGPQYRGGYSR